MEPQRPRTLGPFILERGCPEFQELKLLRAEGWQDESLKDALDHLHSNLRRAADYSTAEDDEYWLPLMFSSLQAMDKLLRCIPVKVGLHFLDLCCCPGGFSKYVLTKNVDAQGVGVSLEVENGGHGLAIPDLQRARFDMHWADLTFFDICSPVSRSPPPGKLPLFPIPFSPRGFHLVILDGQHRRPQESESTHPWDIDRLTVAQLIIALESLDDNGTLIVKFTHLESSTTARLFYMLDTLSKTIAAFKPHIHANRSSFYAVARGVGRGVQRNNKATYLEHLKHLWWELTYGGPEGVGRWINEDDLDFIVDPETLINSYLDRLIKLGRMTWGVQANALKKKFLKIRGPAVCSSNSKGV